jgi:class IV lanthipeptide synthase
MTSATTQTSDLELTGNGNGSLTWISRQPVEQESATRLPQAHRSFEASAHHAEREWQQLCNNYLPIRPKASIWRFSREGNQLDLSQGWKLHVSATILNACSILRVIAPYLTRHNVLFKAPKSLVELQNLNAGLSYGFSQVGKFVTVYPASAEAAVEIAADLHAVTTKFAAPMVPYDNALRKKSCVYYRYGCFSLRRKVRFRKKRVPAIRRPDGKLVPDFRRPGAAVPRWLRDPFQPSRSRSALAIATPLETDYTGYEALVQRGRGGVYRARDILSSPTKSCVIKEGRRHGETDWVGRDGFFRIKREAQFLRSVGNASLPKAIKTFRANGSYYLVLEDISGRSLRQVLVSRERISTRRMLGYCVGMARIVADIHAAGWAWRDCKPGNFFCQQDGKLRAIDFEGVCGLHESSNESEALLVGTLGYLPRTGQRNVRSLEAMDLYALGTSIMQLIARSRSAIRMGVAFEREIRRRMLPPSLAEAIRNLRSPNPKVRLSARATQQLLETLLESNVPERSNGAKASDSATIHT